jgi:uncharacterized protein (DUF58 family)
MPAAAHAMAVPERATLAQLIALRAAGERLRLTARRVPALTSGGHLAQIRGRGIEYDESRLYQDGDDLRTIDWRVTARTGKPHTKIFREERNRPVVLWVDLRAPMRFATCGAFKAVRAAETAALMAWSAALHGDRLGGLVFNEHEHHELRPSLGRRGVLRWLSLLTRDAFWTPSPVAAASSGIEHALARLLRVTRPGSSIFLLSDFRGGADLRRPLQRLAAHGDVTLVHFYDPIEAELPPPGRYRIAVGGRSMTIDTANADARQAYRRQFETRRASLREICRLPQLRLLECATHEEPHAVLQRHFATD